MDAFPLIQFSWLAIPRCTLIWYIYWRYFLLYILCQSWIRPIYWFHLRKCLLSLSSRNFSCKLLSSSRFLFHYSLILDARLLTGHHTSCINRISTLVSSFWLVLSLWIYFKASNNNIMGLSASASFASHGASFQYESRHFHFTMASIPLSLLHLHVSSLLAPQIAALRLTL